MTDVDTTPQGDAAGGWWAPGLNLVERLAGPRGAAPDGGDPSEGDRRLRAWADAHGLGAMGRFAERLGDAGLDERELLDLLTEPREALAARVEKPAWARFTDATLAGPADPPRPVPPGSGPLGGTAAGTVPPVAGEEAWRAGVARVLTRHLACAGEAFAAGCAEAASAIDVAAVRAGLLERLAERLTGIAARTLVFELGRMRTAGSLTGATGEERFADFVRQMSAPAGRTAFLTGYPVLARLLAQTCERSVAAAVRTVRRFAADRADIVAALLHGQDPGRLVALESGAGDEHQGGETVTVLRFGNGHAVVYKPRPQTVHTAFNDVVRWLDDRLPGTGLAVVNVLARTGYGWTEYVGTAPCADAAAVGRYYERFGVLLALLYALDAADMHCENIIARGDQPILVDVETLFHPALTPASPIGTDPALAALTASVSRVALLPQPVVGDHGALDISGLGGDRDQLYPHATVTWEGWATDGMRLVRRPAPFAGADNRPVLDGREVDPVRYTAALLAGFQAGYDALATHAAELTAPDGPLAAFADADLRVIVRPTRTYTTLLDESTHPDVMRDALDRDRLFDVLWAGSVTDPLRLGLVRHETAELWRGDVPMFTARPGARDLWDGRGHRIADVLGEPPLDGVLAKVHGLSDVDRYDQEWVIRATLATRAAHSGHDTGAPTASDPTASAPSPDRLLAAARRLANSIVARGYGDHDRVNWLGLELLDERHWTVMPLGAGLASGYTGTAVFLAEVAALCGDERCARAARRALSPLRQLIDHLSADPDLPAVVGCGGFAGFGGIAYAVTRVATVLADPALADLVEPLVRFAATAVRGTDESGLVDGAAGCLAAMLAVHRTTGLDLAWRVALECADRLLDRPAPPGAGLAFGAAGVGWAVNRLADVGGGYAARGAQLLRTAVEHADPRVHSWCHGAPGIALALLDTGTLAEEPWARAFVSQTLDTIGRSGPLPNHSLCHGELGRMETYASAARGGHVPVETHLLRTGSLLAVIERAGPRCGTPGEAASPGLLNGVAGIGLGLLRLGFPTEVPSVLLLAPSVTHTKSGAGAGSPRRRSR